ncbi:DUF6901 family protein [Candidatus Omnitrophota bacterium]
METAPQPPNSESIKYYLKFDNGITQEFTIHLEKKTFHIIETPRDVYPEWTKLTCHQCPHCPLKAKEHEFCPIAKNLVSVIEFLCNLLSYEEVDIRIETKNRNYSKRTPLQVAAGSLIGIYMVTSGCPIMDKLRPMVQTHLPFANNKETEYRAISMYLIAQYLLFKNKKKPDWDLKNFTRMYKDINIVNANFCQRLKEIHVEDASLNAIIRLDNFAQYINLAVSEQMLDDLKCLFQAYLV